MKIQTAILILALSLPASARQLTREEADIIGYVVVDPQGWADHAIESLGDEVGEAAIRAKVEKYRQSYEAASKDGSYQSRAIKELAEISEKAN